MGPDISGGEMFFEISDNGAAFLKTDKEYIDPSLPKPGARYWLSVFLCIRAYKKKHMRDWR